MLTCTDIIPPTCTEIKPLVSQAALAGVAVWVVSSTINPLTAIAIVTIPFHAGMALAVPLERCLGRRLEQPEVLVCFLGPAAVIASASIAMGFPITFFMTLLLTGAGIAGFLIGSICSNDPK